MKLTLYCRRCGKEHEMSLTFETESLRADRAIIISHVKHFNMCDRCAAKIGKARWTR